jgi:hypothetical protein
MFIGFNLLGKIHSTLELHLPFHAAKPVIVSDTHTCLHTYVQVCVSLSRHNAYSALLWRMVLSHHSKH